MKRILLLLLAICCFLGGEKDVKAKAKANRGAKAGDKRQDNALKMTLVWCPAGRFVMGSQLSEENRSDDEGPVTVTLTQGFWLGQTEVTQSQWTAVMGSEPWKDSKYVKKGRAYPVTHVTWDEAVNFCERLTISERRAGRLAEDWKYALPTEAQWEYACRARTKTPYSFAKDMSKLSDYAWFEDNAGKIDEDFAHRVATKHPNPWGLLDMHGNVYEWCQDAYTKKLPGGRDPLVTSRSVASERVARGGCWDHSSRHCRSSYRFHFVSFLGGGYTLGFRVALVRTEMDTVKPT